MSEQEIRLSIAIQAHPARAPLVNWTLERLQFNTPAFPENVHLQVVYDRGHNSCWLTAYECWKSMPVDFGSTHHMQMTDDAIPCKDFLAGALAAIRAKPDVPISFFARNKNVLNVQARGEHWFRLDIRPWPVGLCFPAHLVPSFLDYAEQPEIMDRNGYWEDHDDCRIWEWMKKINVRHTWCTVPSLLEHGLPSNSLMGHSNRLKVATAFIGLENSPLGIDWSGK
jgi:hypothetical protein